jgi:hypothetical protein
MDSSSVGVASKTGLESSFPNSLKNYLISSSILLFAIKEELNFIDRENRRTMAFLTKGSFK